MGLPNNIPITAQLVGGEFSQNFTLPSGATIKLILIVPTNTANEYTVTMTSFNSNNFYTRKVKGRLHSPVDIPIFGIHTIAITGATKVNDRLKIELFLEQ